MRLYFLALATIVVVCVGCQADGPQFSGFDGAPPGLGQPPLPKHRRREYYAPPAELMMRPGPMVDGPGPGVLNSLAAPPPRTFATAVTQVSFVGPEGMQIGWQIAGGYAERQRMAPSRYNFHQGATYRLKLTDIPGRDGLVLYPSLQVYPSHPQTDAYLSHNCVPVQITDEDLDQIVSNNFVTKVIYLPSPAHQELAIAGVETLVSTRLDPGVDPVAEADRRGTIMAVLRLGNMNLEAEQSASGPVPAGGIQQASFHKTVDGQKGEFAAPLPIAGGPTQRMGIPGPMMMGAPGMPGGAAFNPVQGLANAPTWGMPMTSTPIGLPGPPHLPYGGPASLRSHTVRNLTKQRIPDPVDDLVIDVKHKPGIEIPKPVKHVEYTEKHDVDF